MTSYCSTAHDFINNIWNKEEELYCLKVIAFGENLISEKIVQDRLGLQSNFAVWFSPPFKTDLALCHADTDGRFIQCATQCNLYTSNYRFLNKKLVKFGSVTYNTPGNSQVK